MKKYLIALPLVLIMILSMVPVMAANKNVKVPVRYYKTPDKNVVVKEEVRDIEVDEAILKDAKKLEAAVKAKVESFGFPKLDTDVQPEWVVEVNANAAVEASTTYFVITEKKALTFADLKALNDKITFDVEGLNPAPKDTDKVQETLANKFNKAIEAIVAGNGTAAASDLVVKVEKDDVKEGEEVTVTIASVGTKDVKATPATADAIAYPKCIVDPKDEVEKWCPELCEYIHVRVWNIYSGLEVEALRRSYKVEPKSIPTYDKIYNHFLNTYFYPFGGLQIVKDWKGENTVRFPKWTEDDCAIDIYVLPLNVWVDVYHVLMDCCETLDGDVQYKVWKKFYEYNVPVPFITYHSTPVVDSQKAAEWANTRLQKINATDFVFQRAEFNDGINLDRYMTGEVYDMNGDLVTIVYNENPAITLIYHRVGCDKEEEKVDNATVENTNTQAPVTASGTQLPATGAKDVTAFFLSAVALLGLGIFFAKKH